MGVDGQPLPEQIVLEVRPELATVQIQNRIGSVGCRVETCPRRPLSEVGQLNPSGGVLKRNIWAIALMSGIDIPMTNRVRVVRTDVSKRLARVNRRSLQRGIVPGPPRRKWELARM